MFWFRKTIEYQISIPIKFKKANIQQIVNNPISIVSTRRSPSCLLTPIWGERNGLTPILESGTVVSIFMIFFYKLTLTPKVKLYYKKESVESSAYLSGGSGKPKEQINNTPHLYRYAHDSA